MGFRSIIARYGSFLRIELVLVIFSNKSLGMKRTMVSDSTLARLRSSVADIELADASRRGLGVNRCQAAQNMTHMSIKAPSIMLPLNGPQVIEFGGQRFSAQPGEFLILPPGVEVDVKNLPDIKTEHFASALLVFDEDTIGQFGQWYGKSVSQRDMPPRWKSNGSEVFYMAIHEWLSYSRTFGVSLAQTRHRMSELLLILCDLGVAGNLLFQNHQNTRQKVKHMLALDPAKDWRISDLTQALGQSESTLRRQLSEEGTQFRELLEEVRLDHGIDLVMATDMPIGQIAFDCGYQSQSRFTERFRLRYSLSPTQLRSTRNKDADVISLIPRSRATND